MNHKRIERIWRKQGLKIPKEQPKRGRLWLNDGSCIRLRPAHRNHVWSYDFDASFDRLVFRDVPDAIFVDSFESGDTGAWTTN